MNLYNYIGVLMILGLFVGFFFYILIVDGTKEAMKVYGSVLALIAFISTATYLMSC